MSGVRRVLLLVLVAGSMLCTACEEPPSNEMQQAQGAIDAARAAGAEQYASDEFAAAVDALKRANDAVADRDYRLALNNALDSRERAKNATKQASDQKAAERATADTAIQSAARAIAAAEARLKSAETRLPPKTVSASRRKIADAGRGVQEARAAFDVGNYAKAKAAASAATGQLGEPTRDFEPSGPAASRRRR